MIIRRPVNESSGSYPTKCAIERLAHCRLMAVALVSARAVPALPLLGGQPPAQRKEQLWVNSEKILQRFGSYRVKVLHQDEVSRVANLCSQHDGRDICRTLAVTRFAAPTPEALASADQAIRGGMSIGSTLAEASCAISREVLTEASAPRGSGFAQHAGGTVAEGEALYVRLYRLDAGLTVDSLAPYATIAEAHHPEHLPPSANLLPITGIDLAQWGVDAELAMSALLEALN